MANPPTDEQQKLVDDHVHLAIRAAKQYAFKLHRLEWGDFVSWAFIGLRESAIRYDPSKGVSFEQFSYRRIRGAIVDGVRSYRGRFGQHDFNNGFGQTQSDEESDGYSISAIDNIAVFDIGPDDSEQIWWMRELPAKERKIIRMMAEGYKQQEIGEALCLSASRISQIIANLKDQIRAKLSRGYPMERVHAPTTNPLDMKDDQAEHPEEANGNGRFVKASELTPEQRQALAAKVAVHHNGESLMPPKKYIAATTSAEPRGWCAVCSTPLERAPSAFCQRCSLGNRTKVSAGQFKSFLMDAGVTDQYRSFSAERRHELWLQCLDANGKSRPGVDGRSVRHHREREEPQKIEPIRIVRPEPPLPESPGWSRASGRTEMEILLEKLKQGYEAELAALKEKYDADIVAMQRAIEIMRRIETGN